MNWGGGRRWATKMMAPIVPTLRNSQASHCKTAARCRHKRTRLHEQYPIFLSKRNENFIFFERESGHNVVYYQICVIYYAPPMSSFWERGSTVVKVLCYNSEGRWFDHTADVSGFFIDIISFRSHYGPGVDSASNRNEYQEYFLGLKTAGA